MYSEPSFPLSLYLPASPPIYYAYYLMIIFPSEHHVVGDLGTVLEFAALKPKYIYTFVRANWVLDLTGHMSFLTERD